MADVVTQHTSLQGQTSIKHDLNNANIELDQAKTEIKQKLELLDGYIAKLRVSMTFNSEALRNYHQYISIYICGIYISKLTQL